MAGVDVGGDSSVEWLVLVDHVRNTPEHEPHGVGGWRHHGIDETNDGDFKLTIKVPSDPFARGSFVKALKDGFDAVIAGDSHVQITFPIEGGQPKQIQINWDSKPITAGHGRPTGTS
jgi:hypothetical protein